MSGSITQVFTIDAAPLSVPVVTPDAPAEAGYGETVQIGTISAADAFNQLSVLFVGNAPQGTLSINAEDQILYTAPTGVQPGEVDNFTYEIEQSTGGISAPVSVSIALDDGPTATTVSDMGQGAVIGIAGGGNDVLPGAASDPSLVVDLAGGLGGYASASSVLASLTSDGNGGALLSFGVSHGSLDFVGVAPSALHAANFQIG